MYPTDLTVSAVVENEGRYLVVEEVAMGKVVLNQPGGHIEAGESPEDAVVRETLEESGCQVECGELIGVYLWIHPQTRQQFLRIAYAARFVSCDEALELDTGILGRRWLTRSELEKSRKSLRSPAVLRSIVDFENGRRRSAGRLFSGMQPLTRHIDAVISHAELV